MKTVVDQTGLIAELCAPFGKKKSVGAPRDLGGAAHYLLSNAYLVHDNNKIHIIPVDLPGNAGKLHQIVCHNYT